MNIILFRSQFSTATPEKLYSAFQKQATGDIDIAAVLGSFTTQSGYPVINVDVQANRRDVRITQRLFLLQNKDHNNNTKWEVPLSYATKFDNQNFQSTKNQFLLTSKSNALEINFLEQIDWIVFNVQQTGKFRTILFLIHTLLKMECTKQTNMNVKPNSITIKSKAMINLLVRLLSRELR